MSHVQLNITFHTQAVRSERRWVVRKGYDFHDYVLNEI